MKSKFTAEQWENLKVVPFVVFKVVCGADGTIDEKEIGEFTKRVSSAIGYKDDTHRELMIDIARDFKTHMDHGFAVASDGSRAAQVIIDAAQAMKSALTEQEHQHFGASLLIDGIALARASGGGFFGSGQKISEEEAASLAALAVGLGVNMESLNQFS